MHCAVWAEVILMYTCVYWCVRDCSRYVQRAYVTPAMQQVTKSEAWRRKYEVTHEIIEAPLYPLCALAQYAIFCFLLPYRVRTPCMEWRSGWDFGVGIVVNWKIIKISTFCHGSNDKTRVIHIPIETHTVYICVGVDLTQDCRITLCVEYVKSSLNLQSTYIFYVYVGDYA